MSTLEQELHNTVRNGTLSHVQAVLKKGADLDGIYYGWSPLQQAIDVGKEDVAIFLIDKGCDFRYHDNNHVSPFEAAIKKNLPKVCDMLLRKGIDGNKRLSDEQFPLCVAVDRGSVQLVNVLISENNHHGKVDLNCVNKSGQSPLYIACLEGLTKIATTLITAGADVNFQCEEDGQTPLIAATTNEHPDIIKVLLKYNCDVDAQDCDGWTALWHAYSNSSEELVEILLKAGADKNIPNSDGITIIEDARENEDDEMVNLFMKYAIV